MNDYDEGWACSQEYLDTDLILQRQIPYFIRTLIARTNSVGKSDEYYQGRIDCYKQHLTIQLLKGKVV